MKQPSFSPGKKFTWLLTAFLGKLLISLLLMINLGLLKQDSGLHILYGGDGIEYVKAAYNLKNSGVYTIYEDQSFYSGRMMGYETVIAFFSFFTNHLNDTLHLVVLFQLILASVSVYLLALIAGKVFKSDTLFYFVFFAYLVSTYVSVFDISILTESLAVSSFIFSLYFLLRGKSRLDYFIAGIWLTWTIFLRQYMAPCLLLFAGYIMYLEFLKNRRVFPGLKYVLIFLTAFLLADTAWIIRNYNGKGRIIPLVDDYYAGYVFPERFKSLMEFVRAWGGDLVWWNPKADILAFTASDSLGGGNKLESLPQYIYTSKYSLDSLKKIKTFYILAEKAVFNSKEQLKYDSIVAVSLNEYRASFIKEKPFYYYVFAPLRLFPRFIFHSGTYNISNVPYPEQGLSEKLYKYFYTIIYLLIVCTGLPVALFILLRNFTIEQKLIAALALYVVLLCPLVLKRIEYRYLVISYPFLLMLCAYVAVKGRSALAAWLKNR